MTRAPKITRRRALKVTAGAIGAASLPLVHVQTANAAGKLTLGIWDHWVKAANPVLQGVVDEWAAKNKVEVKIDFISSIGNKMILTQAAEAQARSGHDILAFDQWNAHQYSDKLVPVNDVMEPLLKKYGPVGKAIEYLGIADGKWIGVPVSWGTAPLPTCARISLIKKLTGEDVTEWYPAKNEKTKGADAWTYEKQLKMAEACHKGGKPFALGCGSNSTDANQTWGATFGAFGAHLVDGKGNITVDSDAVREVMDYCKRLVAFLPRETISYDDAANNRAFISRPDGTDLEPAQRLGRGQARCARNCSRYLALPEPQGQARPARTAPALFLGHLAMGSRTSRRPRIC